MKNFMLITMLFAQLVLFLPCSLLGEEEKNESIEPVRLENIVVRSTKEADELTTKIPVAESTCRVATTPADVLDTMSGIDISRSSLGTPDRNMIRIRGLSEDRYMVNLDGRPLSGAGVYGGYYVD